MAKAADNADWKARWGSVHHTDRTLLAHYRASLKSAIQRKANITQAISRYEKLLNRTQKAATDIKRLRPLVEDAINKGILDALILIWLTMRMSSLLSAIAHGV